MMTKSENIQLAHHRDELQMRRQDRIVQNDNFAKAWDRASKEERRVCLRLMRRLKVEELKLWISKILFNDLSVQRVIILRRLASQHSIKGYCNMSKEELLQALMKRNITHGKSRPRNQ